MNSPLTQQTRPESFEPKIVQLYQQLFSDNDGHEAEDVIPTEGFWREMFLHRPEKQLFNDVLEPLSANQLLHLQFQTRLFFRKAIEEAGSGLSPRNENALENLTGFLSAVLSKRYTNPSTDVIEVLAGLDNIDRLVSDFVRGLEAIIMSSQKLTFRLKAVDTSLAMVSGSYQTSLVTYFMQTDLFPALTRFAYNSMEADGESLLLLGLLANYNKFEAQNLYQNRLEEFADEVPLGGVVDVFTSVYTRIRDQYISIQDDVPSAWTLNSTLSLIPGLKILSTEQKKSPPPSEDQAKAMFNTLPSPDASVMLTAYSLTQANKLFRSHMLSNVTSSIADSPLSAFFSTSSYLCHHAYRSNRAAHYAELSLLTIRTLLDDNILLNRLCSADLKATFRLARQRAPYLPYISTSRIPATVILDICTDALSHNIRKRLSISLYGLILNTFHRLITHLDTTKTRLQHHWSYIWGSLLSLMRFLTQYANELTPTYAIRTEICTPLASLLAFCLSRGDNFLPDPSSYDDLFYKLIEATTILPKFKDAYCLASTTKPATPSLSRFDQLTLATNALLGVTSHFQSLLTSSGRRTHQSPATVQKILKEGYETLPDLQNVVGSGEAAGPGVLVDFGCREKWRESEWKIEIKRIIRTVVEDAKVVALKAR